jgi:hypothetical protein
MRGKLLKLLVVLAALLLGGCSAQTVQTEVALKPKPNSCTVTDSEPRRGFSEAVFSVYWDARGRAIGMTPGVAVPPAAIAARLGSSAIEAAGVGLAGQEISHMSISVPR